MNFRTSRLTSRRARRLSGAALALVYFWAFVALGLTHTHGAVAAATRRALSPPALAGISIAFVGPAAPAADDDSTCPLCAAVHAATAALAQPPTRAAALLPTRRLAVAPPSFAPAPILQAPRSRAPPTDLA